MSYHLTILQPRPPLRPTAPTPSRKTGPWVLTARARGAPTPPEATPPRRGWGRGGAGRSAGRRGAGVGAGSLAGLRALRSARI